jgi:hypothetical protein
MYKFRPDCRWNYSAVWSLAHQLNLMKVKQQLYWCALRGSLQCSRLKSPRKSIETLPRSPPSTTESSEKLCCSLLKILLFPSTPFQGNHYVLQIEKRHSLHRRSDILIREKELNFTAERLLSKFKIPAADILRPKRTNAFQKNFRFF